MKSFDKLSNLVTISGFVTLLGQTSLNLRVKHKGHELTINQRYDLDGLRLTLNEFDLALSRNKKKTPDISETIIDIIMEPIGVSEFETLSSTIEKLVLSQYTSDSQIEDSIKILEKILNKALMELQIAREEYYD